MATKKMLPYEGFPKDLPDFLWGLSFNNERPWFEAHREDYERCLNQPFRALCREVCDRLGDRFPGAADEAHISRIYRDARRLYGRGPYNDHLWCSLGRTGELYDVRPKFWFGINARCVEYGMGMWGAKGDILERWRREIDEHPERLSKIIRKVNKIEGIAQWGEIYKRPKGDPGKLLFSWYNARQIGLEGAKYFDPDPPGPELADELVELFSQLMPFYEYMMEICTRGD